jgi:uncharacterized protein YdaU (DUF1376 family)
VAINSDTWMPLYIAKYLRKTMHLTRDQHGGYFLMLMACWDGGGKLPNNPTALGAITKSSPSEWKKLAPVLLPYFLEDGQFLTHEKVITEHQKAARLSAARQESGAMGGRPRKKKEPEKKPIGFEDGNQNGLQTETPLQEPYGSNLEREESNDPSLSGEASPSERSGSKRAREVSLPEGFPSAGDIKDAEKWINDASVILDAPSHAKRFRNHAATKDRRERNWPAAWRSWIDIEIEKAPKQEKVSPTTSIPWRGPADVRKEFVSAFGEPWTRSYVDPCGWLDVPERALIQATGVGGDELRKRGASVLAKLGIVVRAGKAA